MYTGMRSSRRGHLVGENIAGEKLDSFGHLGFIGEQLPADAAQFVEHHAARHLRGPHEDEPEPLREKHPDLDELSHHERRGHHPERQVGFPVASRNSIFLSRPGSGRRRRRWRRKVGRSAGWIDRTGSVSRAPKNSSRFAKRRFGRSASPWRRFKKSR